VKHLTHQQSLLTVIAQGAGLQCMLQLHACGILMQPELTAARSPAFILVIEFDRENK
jgi:hypothetical protein